MRHLNNLLSMKEKIVNPSGFILDNEINLNYKE
jgi:hypothetical protein